MDILPATVPEDVTTYLEHKASVIHKPERLRVAVTGNVQIICQGRLDSLVSVEIRRGGGLLR